MYDGGQSMNAHLLLSLPARPGLEPFDDVGRLGLPATVRCLGLGRALDGRPRRARRVERQSGGKCKVGDEDEHGEEGEWKAHGEEGSTADGGTVRERGC